MAAPARVLQMPNGDNPLLLSAITRRLPQLLLVTAVLSTPWLRGGVDEPVQIFLCGTLLLATTAVLIGRVVPRSDPDNSPGSKMPWATLPILAGALLGVSQLVPLPRTVVGLVSPKAVQLRELPTLDAPDGDSPASEHDRDAPTAFQPGDAPRTFTSPPVQKSWYTVSLRPTATWHDLVLLILALAAFCLAWQLFSSRHETRILCQLVAVNGAALALFGIIQKLTWNGRFYWIGPETQAGLPFAAFVNRNNAGGYLNLCLAAGVVAVLWAINRRRKQIPRANHAAALPGRRRRRRQKPAWNERFRQSLAGGDPLTLTSMFLTTLIAGGVLCTLSRGAGVGLFAATAAAFGIAVFGNKAFRSGGFGLVIVGGLGLVGWVGMYDPLLRRLETLQDSEALATEGRFPNWLDALQVVPEYWLTGSGLGTYRDIYWLYQQRYDPGWYYHAENQYLQALVEGGVPALMLLLAAIGLVAWASWRLTRGAATATDYALGVGGVFVLASQAVCGCADFGLYLPANMLLMAVLCGAISGRAANIPSANRDSRTPGITLPPAVQTVLIGLLSLGLAIGGWQHWTLETTKQLMSEVSGYSTSPGTANADEIRAALGALNARANLAPNYEELHYEIATANIYLYRVQMFAQLRPQAPPSVSLDELWQQASTTDLHRQAQQIIRQGDPQQLDALRSQPLIQQTLRPALRHLQRSRDCCPILPKTFLHLARICFLEDGRGCDEPYIERACELSPSNATVFRTAGLLDLQAGRIEQACSRWRHVLSLTVTELDFVLQQSQTQLEPETIVEHVLPPSPQLMLDMVEDPRTPAEWHELLLGRGERLLSETDLPEDEKHFVLGRTYRLQGQRESALQEFKQATELRPRELAWRFAYARSLLESESYEEAEREILVCTRRQPGNREYRSLLQEIREKGRGTRD